MNTAVLLPALEPVVSHSAAAPRDFRSLVDRTFVVILAAGRGTRMGRDDLAKVSLEIDGVPAISRIITTFKGAGFRKFLVVVNSHAEQVMTAVAREHPEASFAFQSTLLGTGHAARAASGALEAIGHAGPVLIMLGDKYIEEGAITALLDGHIRQRADFSLLTIARKKSLEANQGRVMTDSMGQAVAIVEDLAIAKQAIVDELRSWISAGREIRTEDLAGLIGRRIPSAKKQAQVVAELLEGASRPGPVDRVRLEAFVLNPRNNLCVDGVFYTAEEVESQCDQVNPSLYLLEPDAFFTGVRLLGNENDQREFYVTDFLRHLTGIRNEEGQPRFRVRTVLIDRGEWIQGFNSPDELLRIQEYVRTRNARVEHEHRKPRRVSLPASLYAPVNEWLRRLDQNGAALQEWLHRIYGAAPELHMEKRNELRKVIEVYGHCFGFSQKVVIVRAPGRINLMGRHVDHRGGFNSFLALDRETFMVAGARDDDRLKAVNANRETFRKIDFSIHELLGRVAWSDWLHFVESGWVREHLMGSPGDWGNYLKAAVLRLQHHYQDLRIQGMDLAVSGCIPMAAGLSSSSSLVVATSQAAIALNNLELTSSQFIDLCGQGEWFVGSRGGAGDHAAIYLGQRNKIVHVGNLPFRKEAAVDAPAGYRVIIANSHIKAAKSGNARDLFNSRITCYNLGLALLKERAPEIASRVEYLRDIDPERLGMKLSQLYQLLLRVPEVMTRRELEDALGARHEALVSRSFADHKEQEGYLVRGVLLFGIAECARSRKCLRLLEEGRVEEFGRMMNVSHNGDRVVDHLPDGTSRPHPSGCSDTDIYRLLADLASEDPERVVRAQLINQPGYYACSTPEIDLMADLVQGIDGVAGAQIAGAGLGGCLMILAKEEAISSIRNELVDQYYSPRNLPSAICECRAVEGAGLVDF
jgi:N-acetylgalactosamine kinase